MSRIFRTCKKCNKPFSISDKEQAWLKTRCLELFSSCSECRKRKVKYEDSLAFPNVRLDINHPNALVTAAMMAQMIDSEG